MSDQRYPYGRYDQYGQPQPQPPHPAAPYQDPPYQDPSSYQDPSYQDPSYQDPHAQDSHAQDPRAQGPYTQTWDGQTWDTQYQPVQQPADHPRQQPPPAYTGGHQQPQSRPGGQYTHAQDPHPYSQGPEPAYLPPQSYPLPPETPAPAPTPAPAAAAAAPYEAPAAGGPAYSNPSMAGNSRITDAQRARAEGRSPIIAPGMRPAGLTAGLALLIAAAAFGGRYAVVVPLLVLQALTAAGWFRLNGMWPARQGIALAFAGGVVADVALLVAGAEHGPAAIIGTLGVWVLLTYVLQLRSQASPDERMAGLMATIASSALTVLATGTLAASMDAVTVGGIAVAVAVVVRALPLPGAGSVVAALVAAAGAGILAGGMTDLGAQGALLGFAAGGCALIGLRVASYDYPSRFVHMTAGVALPLTAAAPAIYLIGRVVG